MRTISKEQIAVYVSTALFLTASVDQLISMVILHFDIPDKQAKQMVTEYLREYHPNLLEEIKT
jgi:hypothetical protein